MTERNDPSLLLIQLIGDSITSHTGIKMSINLLQKLQKTISTRITLRQCDNIYDYKRFLDSGGFDATHELELLAQSLVNLETSFFRDHGQMHLLKDMLLPEIIAFHQFDKTLKVWSAGCSSGQELYSIAMLIKQILPRDNDWNPFLFGSDICHQALQTAKKGLYTESQMKGIDPVHLKREFSKEKDNYLISPLLKKMCTFKEFNLVSESCDLIEPRLKEVDLIICRNVFIYFTPQAIEKVVRKFYQILRKNGVLVTGHGELIHINHPFKMVMTENSIFFRKE